MAHADTYPRCRISVLLSRWSRRTKILLIGLAVTTMALIIFLACFFALHRRAAARPDPSGFVSISPPPLILSTPSNLVSPDFVGLAVEERSMLYYAGNRSSPNTFSQALISELAKRTNSTIAIRVGGTSLDHSVYVPNQALAVAFPPGEAVKNVPNNLHFGPSYFESLALLSPVHYTVDVPLAKNNLQNAIRFAQQAQKTLSLTSPSSFTLEAGNEPNLYPGNERPSSYGPAAHIAEWARWTTTIASALGFNADTTPLWQVGMLATGKELVATPWTVGTRDAWTIRDLFDTGGLSQYLPRIKSLSLHYYQTISSVSAEGTQSATSSSQALRTQLQRDLMNHTALASGLTEIVAAAEYVATNYPQLPFVLDEANSALNPHARQAGGGTVNNAALEGVLGAALWSVDFLLYCASNKVRRVQLQQGIGFGFAAWQPVAYKGKPAGVRAPFYGMLFAADFIGSSTVGAIGGSSGTTIAQLSLTNVASSLDKDTLVAYAAYTSGRLSRVALLNMRYWSPQSQAPRGSISFALNNIKASTVEVWRLTSPVGASGFAENDLSYAGSTWSAASGGREQVVNRTDRVVLPVQNGRVVITVADSEAALVWIQA